MQMPAENIPELPDTNPLPPAEPDVTEPGWGDTPIPGEIPGNTPEIPPEPTPFPDNNQPLGDR